MQNAYICNIFKVSAGLKKLNIKCDDSTKEYNLQIMEYGSSVADAVNKLTRALEVYNETPKCTSATGLEFGPDFGIYCEYAVFYYEQTCTFQIAKSDVYGPACVGVNIYMLLLTLIMLIIFWICFLLCCCQILLMLHQECCQIALSNILIPIMNMILQMRRT